jgi:hypothetical protein
MEIFVFPQRNSRRARWRVRMEENSGLTVMHKPLLFVNAPSFRESSSRNIIVSPGEKLQFLPFVKHIKRSR